MTKTTENLPTTYDAAWAKRMAEASEAADQRVSAGHALVDTILDFKKGDFLDARFPDQPPRAPGSVFVVPVLIRESRTFWMKPVEKGEAPHAPDCKSVNGLEPVQPAPVADATPLDDVLQPQAKTCAECPWNKFGTADNGGGGKKCKTGGNLFGIEVDAAGKPVGSILVRYSASNSDVNKAIDLADRQAKERSLPRVLTIWRLDAGRGKFSGGDFKFLRPSVAGPAPKELYPVIEKTLENLREAGAVDRFLGATGAASVE